MINMGLCIVPMYNLAKRIDSNVVNYERCKRELPSAELSITLPILLMGLEVDPQTQIVDVSQCQFQGIKDIIGRGRAENRWRIINGFMEGTPMKDISPFSPIGPYIIKSEDTEE
jgi:hypothetical protein